ncbi:hypothetical protein A4X13_0g8240 [Tilletia indica]|uniref:HAT C-terminal dimerisation domain-containing protein n=1 Tax=Tilletia indica TaxID=43049 RepID=A0A8T8SFR2_9BASI|nr:hypothetical protein A4X13_0g8240 [Tilletia indica]
MDETIVSAAVEAAALKLVGQYRFTSLSREDFDTAIDLLDMGGNQKREYKLLRTFIMQAEPDEDPFAEPPRIHHKANKEFFAKMAKQTNAEEWGDLLESQEMEQELGGNSSPAPNRPRTPPIDKVQQPPARPKATLFIPGGKNQRPRRTSRSPSRLHGYDLGVGPSKPHRLQLSSSASEDEQPEISEEEDDEEGDSSVEGSSEEGLTPRGKGKGKEKQTKESKKGKKKKKGKKRRKVSKAQTTSKPKTSAAGTSKTTTARKRNMTEEEETEFQEAARTSGARPSKRVRRGRASRRDGEDDEEDAGGDEHDGRDNEQGDDDVEIVFTEKERSKLTKPALASLDGGTLAKGYYGFKFKCNKVEDGKLKECWNCLFCKNPYTVAPAKNNNLSSHRKKCPYNKQPRTPGLPPYDPKVDAAAVAAEESRRSAPGGSLISDAAGSYRGPGVMGWLSGQQVVSLPLIRRIGLIETIYNAQPFTHLGSPANLALVMSIDEKAVPAFKSNDTVRNDLIKFNALQKEELRRRLHNHDSLITLQHDAWTMRGHRFAFVAIVASFVDRDWQHHEVLLSFQVLDKRHSGATFAGHLVDTIIEFDLQDKWSGIVVSDSASPNRRMTAILQEKLSARDDSVSEIAACLLDGGSYVQGDTDQEGENNRGDDGEAMDSQVPLAFSSSQTSTSGQAKVIANADSVSVSAFPQASKRSGFQWTAQHCGVLCFAHHLNIAVRDGFKAMGVKFAAQLKVIPVPQIIEPGGIEGVEDEDAETDDESGEGGEGDGDGAVEPRLCDVDIFSKDNAPPADEHDEDDDDDALIFMSPDERARAINRLGDGPPPSTTGNSAIDVGVGQGGVWSAVQRVEGFVVAMHRSAERQLSFRAVMRKEYYQDPARANGALPTKPSDTRWNSQLGTLRSAVRVHAAIDTAIAQEKDPKHPYKDFLLTDDDWAHIRQLISLLELAERISMNVQTAGSTLCDVLEYHVLMCTNLNNALRKMGDRDGARMDAQDDVGRELSAAANAPNQMAAAARAMKLKLGKYRSLAAGNRTTVLAAMLHPNHRLKIFKADYPERVNEAESILREAVQEVVGKSKSVNSGSQGEVPDGHKDESPLKAARQERQARVQQGAESEDMDPTDDEVVRYIRGAAAWRDTDGTPNKWWKDNECEFPQLSKLARIVLSVPGSTAAVERVFSHAGWIASARRARLNGTTMGMLVTSYAWMQQGIDRLVGLDDSAKAAGAPILRMMDKTIKAKKEKRSKRRIKKDAASPGT